MSIKTRHQEKPFGTCRMAQENVLDTWNVVGRRVRDGGGHRAQGASTKRRENFPSASGFLSFIAKISAQALKVPRNQLLALLYLQLVLFIALTPPAIPFT